MRAKLMCILAVLLCVCQGFSQNNSIPTPATSNPSIAFTHSVNSNPYGLTTYNASTGLFTMTSAGTAINFPPLALFCSTSGCPPAVLNLAVQIDNTGKLIGGNPTAGQPDFVLNGQITNGGKTYASPLLTGTVTEFYYDGVNATPNFRFRIAVTGGSMAGLYLNAPSLNDDLWMQLFLETLQATPVFNGTFTSSFGGTSKGNIYATPATCYGKIGDYVWNDLNANGIQDANESGIDGVKVNLLDQSNNIVASTTTVAGPTGPQHGYYQFTGVCSGTYSVQVDETTLPAGSDGKIHFEATTSNAPGSTTVNDSNPNPSTVTLTSNASVDETQDFGYVSLQGAIGDYVWYDANRNGLQDAGEPGINGVVVNLYDSTGTNLLATTTTSMGGPNNTNGYYQFTGLDEGDYVVKVDSTTLPPNYSPTTPLVGGDTTVDSNGSPANVSLPTDSSTDETIDFGYVTPCNGSIGDFVWHDLNRNGLQDSGEPGISGVTLHLYDSGHNLIQTTATDGTGKYTFAGVCDGTYEVDVDASTLPPNFTPTTSHVGTDVTVDSNGSPAPVTLTLDSGNNVSSDTTIDFGYVSPCNGAIGDFVWNDLNGNGIQDANEPGINNVMVSLFDSQNHLLNSTTTINNGTIDGYYQFTGLCAGTYSVQVKNPVGYNPTLTNAAGSTTDNDSNPNPTTVVLSVVNGNGDVTKDESNDFGFVQPITSNCISITAVQGVEITPVTLTATGGSGTGYTFTATGLPPGLVISSSGTISGTPTASGTYNYTVTITDSAGNTGTLNCTITVAPPPVSASCVTIDAVQGVAITPTPLVAMGGTGTGYSFTATGLPPGLSISKTGVISGTPTASGTYNYTVTITDSDGNQGTLNCSITVAPPPVSASCVTIVAVQGTPITPTPLVATGGTGTGYTFTATGLPPGLVISTNGTISGTPTASGTYNYTVTITDSAGNKGTLNCSITVAPPPISASCVSITAVQGTPITPVTLKATGGTGTGYKFSATGLPPGLHITTSGMIYGTPTASGTYNYTVTITDSAGNQGTLNCSITVAPPPIVSKCLCDTATEGTRITPVTMTASGGSGSGYTFSATGLPAGLTMSSSGTISGTPTQAGTFTYTVTIRDSAGNTATVTCTIVVQKKDCGNGGGDNNGGGGNNGGKDCGPGGNNNGGHGNQGGGNGGKDCGPGGNNNGGQGNGGNNGGGNNGGKDCGPGGGGGGNQGGGGSGHGW